MDNTQVKQYCYFENYYQVLKKLNPADRCVIRDAMDAYMFEGITPDFGNNVYLEAIFQSFAFSLNKSKSKSRNGKTTCKECEEDVTLTPIIRTSKQEIAIEKIKQNQTKSKNQNDNFGSSISISTSSISNLGKGGVGEKPVHKSDYTLLSDQLMAYWNETFADTQVPKVLRMTTKRQVGIRQRLDDHYTQKQLFEAIDKARASDFCTNGQWGFGFDWIFCYKGNIQKVLEGNYDNKAQPVSNVDKLLNAARADPSMSIWFGKDPPKKNALGAGAKGDST